MRGWTLGGGGVPSVSQRVQRQEQRLLERPEYRRARRQLTAVVRARGRTVLRPAEDVYAHLRRDVAVPLSGRVGHHQRAAAVPILRRAVEVHHLGQRSGGARPAQDAVAAARERVGLVAVGEREDVGGIEMPGVLGVRARGRGEAVVEESLPAARDHRHQAIEHLPPLLVRVEPSWRNIRSARPLCDRPLAITRPGQRFVHPPRAVDSSTTRRA